MRHQTTGLQNIEFLVKQVSERLKKSNRNFQNCQPKKWPWSFTRGGYLQEGPTISDLPEEILVFWKSGH